ncbi:MAG TPA: hypothetical protein VMH05_17710 [Bryobacteraceae bacterium]|nr:hypothetical protein [Bryobacteraceae bacterium]
MTSTPGESRTVFAYSNLSRESRVLIEPWEVYLHIAAQFEVRVSGQVVYAEELFPVVEFAICSQIWSAVEAEPTPDFIYTSIEAEEEGLIWIKRAERGWRIGSALQEKPSSEVLSLADIRPALNLLYVQLRSDVKTRFQVDIENLFAWKGVPVPRHDPVR